jgi:hypothetical protein
LCNQQTVNDKDECRGTDQFFCQPNANMSIWNNMVDWDTKLWSNIYCINKGYMHYNTEMEYNLWQEWEDRRDILWEGFLKYELIQGRKGQIKWDELGLERCHSVFSWSKPKSIISV